LSSKACGFIRHSYSEGLDPVEAWFNAVVGRDSYIDTAVRTPKSGYMQRRLINALQDLKTNYDGTVRDSGEKIIQFTYGEDNIDVSKSKQGDIA
jgi:DNA-directed RNA polymerase subunit A'